MNAIPYGKQEITEQDLEAVVQALRSDFLTQGPRIELFENEFAKYVGSKYAVAVSNGTAALHLAALALGVSPGKKVITTPMTFAASANCVRYCGGDVAFVDVDPASGLMDLGKLEKLLESNPRGTFSGVIPVDYTGLPLDHERLKQISQKHDLWIIEDACHALGSKNCGNGQYADLTIFSFHPVKHLTTGEGGMITTNNKTLFEKLKKLRTHGITKDPLQLTEDQGGWYYEMQELGYNYRITDFQCALGLSQLKRQAENLNKRKAIAVRYNELFSKNKSLAQKIELPVHTPEHAYHLYVIRVENRKELYNFLKSKNIHCQVHYIPVHLQPYYKELGFKKGDLPVSENFYSRCLSLPMYPQLTAQEQDYVISCISEFYA